MSVVIPSLRAAVAVPGWAKNVLWRNARAVPSLDLRFADNKSLVDAVTGASLVTFTRASSGTFVDSAGVLQTAAIDVPRFDHNPTTGESLGLLVEEQRTNLLTYSELFNASPWAPGSLSVTPTTETTSPAGNSTAARFIEDTVAAQFHFINYPLTKAASAIQYTVCAYAKDRGRELIFSAANGTTGAVARFNLATGVITAPATGYGGGFTAQGSTITSAGNGWYRCSMTFTTDATTGLIIQYALYNTALATNVYTGDGASGIYIWGAQLEAGAFPTSYIPTLPTFVSRASSATFFDSTGTLQTAASGVARSNAFLPDSAGVFRSAGLLLEEARTNSIRNNTMVGAVAGTPGTSPTNWGISVSNAELTSQVIGVGSESGISYIDIKISGTVTASRSLDVRMEELLIASASSGQVWTESIYLKQVGGSQSNIAAIYLQANTYTNVGVYVATPWFTAVTVGSGNLSAQRFAVTGTLSGATTAYIAPFIKISTATAGAVDFTLRIGLPQLEQGAFPTSPILTSTAAATRAADVSTSAAATRSADVASITGTAFSGWYRQDEGTMFAEFGPYGNGGATKNAGIVQIDSGSAANRIGLFGGGIISPVFIVDTSSVNQVYISASLISPSATSKISGSYKINDFARAVNGSNLGTDSSGSVPTVSQMLIGTGSAGVSELNGTIRRLTYWPQALPSRLQALTQ